MAVRPIDAVQVLHNINLHHRPTPVSEFESGFNDGLNQAMWEITHVPTLTQPNEPLTLDELGEMSYTDWVWLEFPREKPSDNCWERGWKAYRLYSHERYGVSWIAYRRPPEGEEEEKHVIEITENL